MIKFLVTLLITIISIINVNAEDKLKVGVLAYGTVNWELDVIKHNKLDKKYGFDLEILKLASKNASSVAIQASSVDMIVTDWLWVNTQRANNKDFTFYPYSKATGTIYTKKDAKTFLDLKAEEVGVAGGAYDKSWLLLRAYSKYKYKKDLNELITPVFASPVILYKKILDGSLNSAINFWHFNAKLKAKGVKPLIEMAEVLKELGIKEDISLVGWTFRRDVALKNKDLYNSFIKASHEAKDILLSNEKEWDRIRPLMKAKEDKVFESLKQGFRQGIIKEFNSKNIEDSKKVFEILLKEGGKNLVSNAKSLDEKTFWNFQK
ncbi:ABC transporter substrate-binding protein [Arcobacter sp. YIC-464]|uniref:ABC transporter substrate-binding protein n=1 Tax=Arcobacter sp. YIC-464 TaxID=3376631 RepID=UPI003C173950